MHLLPYGSNFTFLFILSLFLLTCPSTTRAEGWTEEQLQMMLADAAKSKMGVEGDELIVSGDGAGCWDDEDCSAYSPEPAASDDLITPRIVMVSARPPYNPVQRGFQTSTPRSRYSSTTCTDDEDCVEGSGNGSDDDDDDDDDDNNDRRLVSTTLKPPHLPSPAISYQWPGMRTVAPTPYYARPAPPTPFEDKSIMFTSKPIPPDDPVISETFYERPRPTPPRPTGPRVIIDVPKPGVPYHQREKERTSSSTISSRTPVTHPPATGNKTFSKSSANKTALVIGVVAFIIIAIVIVFPIIIFMKVKYRSAVPKSFDNRLNYQYNPVSGTPQILLPNSAGSVSHLTGIGVPVTGEFKHPPQLPAKKDLKEWYV